MVKLNDTFLGGSGIHQSMGSGLIIMYWREILRRELTKEILESYEWFVITRSDFLWQIEHPNVNLLKKDKVYLLDGEKYEGISDRHIIFHRDNAEKVLAFASPIFNDALGIKEKLILNSYTEMNPEKYLAFIAKEFGLSESFIFIPYLGYAIRHPETSTRWSLGVFDQSRNYFIKYPTEVAATNASGLILRSQGDWAKFFNNEFYFRRSMYNLRSNFIYISKRTTYYLRTGTTKILRILRFRGM